MRILQISSAKTYGGAEKHFVDLCRGLDDRGHEVFVALREENEFEERLEFLPDERRLHVSLRNSVDVLSSHKIARFLKEKEIDIVAAHLARDYPPASLAVRLNPKTKLVLTRHVIDRLTNLHGLVLKNVSKVIAVSSGVEAILHRTFPPEKVVCVPNGIEVEKWAEANSRELGMEFRIERGIPPDAPLIGTVGELRELKGQEDFVLAAPEIVKRHSDAYFLIVGKDNSLDQAYRRKLKRLVKIFELEDRFTFLDWVEETQPLLSALDVFVSPSRSEAFGLAILEAMASGRPIVATETDGARELIKDGETGVLTNIKDPVQLAAAVGSMLEDSEMAGECGKNAKEFARSRFDIEGMIEQTESVYRELLG